MREILFRGQCSDGRWSHGSLCKYTTHGVDDWKIQHDDLHSGGRFSFLVSVDPKTIGQFTGLLDKNGTKIFEGDILCCHNYCLAHYHDHDKNIGVVEYGKLVGNDWDESVYGFKIEPIFADGNISFSLIDNCEVIGNIHEHPDLLKGEVSE